MVGQALMLASSPLTGRSLIGNSADVGFFLLSFQQDVPSAIPLPWPGDALYWRDNGLFSWNSLPLCARRAILDCSLSRSLWFRNTAPCVWHSLQPDWDSPSMVVGVWRATALRVHGSRTSHRIASQERPLRTINRLRSSVLPKLPSFVARLFSFTISQAREDVHRGYRSC
jgi:hypothetical protein